MQTLTITRVVLTPTPSGNTQCSVFYSLGSDPTNWQLIDNNVTVPPDGNLGTALVVSTIPDNETDIHVRAVANCGGTPYEYDNNCGHDDNNYDRRHDNYDYCGHYHYNYHFK
jgi:hypothetical protein